MKGFKSLSHILLLFCGVALLSSCTAFEEFRARQEQHSEQRRFAAQRKEARLAHTAWRAVPGWKSKIYRNKELLALATPENTSVEIDLDSQRGLLLVHGAIAMDFPVATGKKSHPTPVGNYKILAKTRDYSSNLYGKIVDATGTVVVSDADARTDAVPEGGSFQGAKMPYWMRLTSTGVGMHVGYVPGRPASHGCIRLKRDAAVELFKVVKIGTPVVIARSAPALNN